MRYEVEDGAEELGAVLDVDAGADAGVLAVVSVEVEGVFDSDGAALLPASDVAPEPDSEPDSEAGALLLAA
jgi:hypothetical protein